MRRPAACKQCRDARRRCVVGDSLNAACQPCQGRLLHCSYVRQLRESHALFPKVPKATSPRPRLQPATTLEARRGASDVPRTPQDYHVSDGPDLPFPVVEDLVGLYLQKIHHRPHSLFHPRTLQQRVRQGTCSRAMVLAICSMGCRVSADAALREMHGPLATEAKRLLQADLENISLENVQTCCIIANLCEWDCNRSSEALFFRIALGMAEIMDLSAPDTTSPIAEREIKRRVWWTLFAADRWFSSGLRLSRQLEDFQKSIELPMDEDVFHALDPTDMALSAPWKPGLWAHMVGLHQLFGPVLDLNRRCAQGNMPSHERDATVMDIAGRLAAWEDMVPSGDKMTDENFDLHRQRGTGGPFVSLHLAYNYYSLLLYFQYLAHQQPQAPTVETYVQRCKQCAGTYSYLVKMSREHVGCEALFPSVSHMTVVSSSVLLHTLLFGDEWEVASARGALNSNFEVLVDFQQYWPELIAQMIDRLTSFQEMCLLASARNHPTHEFDNWMLRFVVEFALPLEERSFALRAVEEARATVDMHAARFAEQGRITDFGVFHL